MAAIQSTQNNRVRRDGHGNRFRCLTPQPLGIPRLTGIDSSAKPACGVAGGRLGTTGFLMGTLRGWGLDSAPGRSSGGIHRLESFSLRLRSQATHVQLAGWSSHLLRMTPSHQQLLCHCVGVGGPCGIGPCGIGPWGPVGPCGHCGPVLNSTPCLMGAVKTTTVVGVRVAAITTLVEVAGNGVAVDKDGVGDGETVGDGAGEGVGSGDGEGVGVGCRGNVECSVGTGDGRVEGPRGAISATSAQAPTTINRASNAQRMLPPLSKGLGYSKQPASYQSGGSFPKRNSTYLAAAR